MSRGAKVSLGDQAASEQGEEEQVQVHLLRYSSAAIRVLDEYSTAARPHRREEQERRRHKVSHSHSLRHYC